MIKRSIRLLCLFAVGGCLAAPVSAQMFSSGSSNGPAPASTAQSATDDANRAIYCPTALEQILPGDYYACEARAASGRQHYKKMVEMLEEAAYWANKDAQYVLGLTYFNGGTLDVPQNRPLGLAWLALAAERKNPQYQLTYAEARARSSPLEIRQALAEWQRLRVKYGDSIAAARAIRRFNHNIQPIDDAARDGGIVYIRGFSPFPESAFAIANKLHDEADADFSTVHGTVMVGKPEWVQAKPVDNTK
jgi:hypothetical protein